MVSVPSMSLMVTVLPAESDALRNCVASVAHVGDDTVSLVGYNQDGSVRGEFRCHRSDVTQELYAFLLEFAKNSRGTDIPPNVTLYRDPS
jgi:hypothetical protein